MHGIQPWRAECRSSNPFYRTWCARRPNLRICCQEKEIRGPTGRRFQELLHSSRDAGPMNGSSSGGAPAGHRRGTTIWWCIFRHYSLHPFLKLLPPFPMCPALPDSKYYGGSAPSRTDRSTVDPAQHPRRKRGAGQGPERFPCSLTTRSTKEEPNSVPAALPRLPRSTSPWPPGRTSTCSPASSPPDQRRKWVRTAPGPYPPDWSR
jgi:hypothetical protein